MLAGAVAEWLRVQVFERLDLDGDGNVNRIEMIKALRADTGKFRLMYIYLYLRLTV